EIKKVKCFENFSVVSLGSRRHLCVNKEVLKCKTDSILNEKCCELGLNCSFKNREKVVGLSNILSSRICTIAEAADVGAKTRACGYYASREVLKQADIVCLPYNFVLDKGARESMGIELTGSLVIFDEAHNIVQAVKG